ncbi:MAG: hypothetical protein ACD_28C00263G0002 [uncultured bacterium]|nr:MAG: hypothetical protein ACD_28C00263G0002 [uncultured bacterium]
MEPGKKYQLKLKFFSNLQESGSPLDSHCIEESGVAGQSTSRPPSARILLSPEKIFSDITKIPARRM